MPATLYVVATPIGNLEDLTPRAARVLREAAFIAAEDTRRTRNLLTHLGIDKRPLSLPAFAERDRAQRLVDRLLKGDDGALVTDAGTPTVSDPGAHLVALAAASGVPVVPVPGPSAAVAALSASGLVADRFHFFGFLPRKGKARERLLSLAAELPGTLVFFESPERLRDSLVDLARSFPGRRAVVARELTKVHEEIRRGTLEELAAREGAVKGEVTLIVEGAARSDEAEAAADADVEKAVRARLEAGGKSLKDVAREVAEETGRARREVYGIALRVAGRAGSPDKAGC